MTEKELQKLIEDPAITDQDIFELIKEGLDEDKNPEPPTQEEQNDISAFGELCWRLRPEFMIEWQAWWVVTVHFQQYPPGRQIYEEQSKEISDEYPLEKRIRERIDFYLKKKKDSEH